jgi:hypothetical protein
VAMAEAGADRTIEERSQEVRDGLKLLADYL